MKDEGLDEDKDSWIAPKKNILPNYPEKDKWSSIW